MRLGTTPDVGRLQYSVFQPGCNYLWLFAFCSLQSLVFADGPAAYPVPVQNTKPLLTVSFTSGDISLMNNYDDLSPTIIRSGLKGTKISHFSPFLCSVFLVFLMMCVWAMFLWLSLLTQNNSTTVVAISSGDTCWCVFEKMFKF